MSTKQAPLQIDTRRLTVAGILIAVGGLIGAIGSLIGAGAAAQAARQWVQQLDQPPQDVLRQKVRQARVAALAANDAWQKGNGSAARSAVLTGD